MLSSPADPTTPRPRGTCIVTYLIQSIPLPARARRGETVVGRAIDLTIAAVALLVLAVPLLVIGLAVRLTSPGPALFAQTRIGLDGRRFAMYKFRSMRVDAEQVTGAVWATREDPRVTPVGRFLRKTRLDELPQLINVVLGDMALVGPRPCLEWEAELFPAEFRPRFTVRPGITGLWQVSGRSSVSTLDMLQLDLSYVRTRTLSGDLAILARTVPALLHTPGTR